MGLNDLIDMYESNHEFFAQEREKYVKIADEEIRDSLLQVFVNEKGAMAWFYSPHPMLNNESPAHIVQNYSKGEETIKDFIQAMIRGQPS